ncbi:hypothetical protein [Peribacillus sp. YIM B13477]|uniref:hypothetical protein n=1 Tax=Peribacillus sp. YIM B13477 TaxID=3366300 RepID=UPI003671DB69
MNRLFDLFLGLVVGAYFSPILILFGFTVHWAVIGLVFTGLLILSRKVGRLLWKKFIKTVKEELQA